MLLRLKLLGPDSQIASSLCARCPHSPAGCCVGPPPLSLSDLGRIVGLGGRDFLLAELSAGRLLPSSRGLDIKRTKGRASDARGSPRVTKCVFHGPSGCTIEESRRSVTCNLYICESALDEEKSDHDLAREARNAHAEIVKDQVRVGEHLAAEIRARYPDGAPYDAAFFDWLGDAYTLTAAAARSSPQ